MRYRAISLALLFLLLRMPPVQAKEAKWFEFSSEHFLLFTDTNEAKGRRLISDFENRVAAFSQAFGKLPARQFPIEVFLFNNEQDFIEALPHAKGEEELRKTAYLLRGPDRTFIVAKDKSPDDIANDVGHALGHVLFERYVLWRPFWLAESSAEHVDRKMQATLARRLPLRHAWDGRRDGGRDQEPEHQAGRVARRRPLGLAGHLRGR